MVFYTYTASGSLNLRKCGLGYSEHPRYVRNTAFAVRDQAWLKYRAIKGILEWIVIKKIRLVDFSYRGDGLIVILYVDTFNALYNEDDLISYADAVILVNNYLYQQELARAAAECLK